MPTQNDFEARRKERRRRERLRKKRIRAVLLLIIFIGIIVLICTAISALVKNNSGNDAAVSDGESVITENAPVATTAPAATTSFSSIPEPSEENNLLQVIADSGQKKRCYLTFDDGPTENVTPQVLDILRRYNVKATFFEVGSLIEANPDMARRVYEEGHLIANHSNGHNYDKLYATSNSFITEVTDCEEMIRSVMDEGDELFKLFRFPGGSYNAGDHASEKQIYKEVLADNGYYYCDWNTLTGDAEGKTKNAAELLEFLKENMEGYNNLIVLMHDASTKQATADALPSVIEYIASQGYTFHRLDDIEYQTEPASTQAPQSASSSDSSAYAIN